MTSSNANERVLDLLQQLSPNATVEDAMERLYFLAKVERGLGEVEVGETVPHSEVKRRLTGA